MAQTSSSRSLQMSNNLSKFYTLGLLTTLSTIIGAVDFSRKENYGQHSIGVI